MRDTVLPKLKEIILLFKLQVQLFALAASRF